MDKAICNLWKSGIMARDTSRSSVLDMISNFMPVTEILPGAGGVVIAVESC